MAPVKSFPASSEHLDALNLIAGLESRRDYSESCCELTLLIRTCYNSSSKNVQQQLCALVEMALSQRSRMEARSHHQALRQLMQAVEATMQKQRRAALIREYKQVLLMCSREGKQKNLQEDEGVTALPPLPSDVLTLILSFLDVSSLGRSAMVCRTWRDAADSDWLWRAHLRSSVFAALAEAEGDDTNRWQQSARILRADELSWPVSSSASSAPASVSFKRKFMQQCAGLSKAQIHSNRVYCKGCQRTCWLPYIAVGSVTDAPVSVSHLNGCQLQGGNGSKSGAESVEGKPTAQQEQQQCSDRKVSKTGNGMHNVADSETKDVGGAVEGRREQQQQQRRRKHSHVWKAVSCDQVLGILSGAGYHSDSDEEDEISSIPFGREIGRLWSRLKVVAAEGGPAYALSYGM